MKKFFFIASFMVSFLFSEIPLYFFWGEGCSRCEEEKVFLKKLQEKYPNITVYRFEVWKNRENRKFLEEVSRRMQIEVSGFPVTIIGRKYFVGFLNEETTGRDIEKAILEYRDGEDRIGKILKGNGEVKYEKGKYSVPDVIKLPLFGNIEVKNISLPILTVIFGLVDGFNPCAMWALMMLISFLIGIRERRKIFLLGGIFIFVSAVVYFMFMVAWLNFLFFFSYIQCIRIIIAFVAILGGIFYIREFFKNKGGECLVTSKKYKRYIAEKLSFFASNRLWLAIFGITVLAFLVNVIELICSAGLPVVYLQVLSMSSLSTLQYYLYLLLYIFFFMLDDLFIFLIAIFSLEMVKMTAKYSRYSHLVGGVVLIGIGMVLIIKPELLMF